MKLYNTLTKRVETVNPIHPGHIGLYVCGPTVYGDAHLGHARCAVVFDVLYRYLIGSGFKVRYVRNITDVGHLEHDSDSGEDKVAKKAALEQLEPMEIAQRYTNNYHRDMAALNVLPPSIEPLASGHIIEQISFIQKIIDSGYAYVSNGSVYFDVEKYSQKFPYSPLAGRSMESPVVSSGEKESEKKSNRDFALWKKASPEHIMHWPSPWSEGFPGWHIECSAMSSKYLGDVFDIHGGGLDLMFPHHEAEIMQSCSVTGKIPANIWTHCNLVTIKGSKMGKSYGNFITLEQLFSGNHKDLDKAYSPMTLRLLILMANYKSPLDFSLEALKAAESGWNKLKDTYQRLQNYSGPVNSGPLLGSDYERRKEIEEIVSKAYKAIENDLNTPEAISALFDSAHIINQICDGKIIPEIANLEELKALWSTLAINTLGLKLAENQASDNLSAFKGAVNILLNLRQKMKKEKNWELSDQIRKELEDLGFSIKDNKDNTEWSLK